MVQFHLPYGLLLDNGTHVVIADGQMQVYGATPAMLVDARTAEWGSLPEFHDPGKRNPRQLGGIVGGRLHIIRPGESFNLSMTTVVHENPPKEAVPEQIGILELYPNPFNASTTIRYRVEGEHFRRVQIVVYDLLGREVLQLLDEVRPAGMGYVRFDGSGLASGTYYCRISLEGARATQRMLLVR